MRPAPHVFFGSVIFSDKTPGGPGVDVRITSDIIEGTSFHALVCTGVV
jgi:hypothetical protein